MHRSTSTWVLVPRYGHSMEILKLQLLVAVVLTKNNSHTMMKVVSLVAYIALGSAMPHG
eukprot:SAG11_NODE_27489_length_332_cov_0.669528_1_plen_58_part_01